MGQSPIQTRFDGGEISPRISGRFDSELYKKALRQSTNFEPLPHGSLRMRSGSEKIQKLTGDARTRFANIRLSTGVDYIAEFLDKKMHLYSLAGEIAAIETVLQSQLITNGDFSLPNGAAWQGRSKVGNWLQDNDTNVSFNDFNGVTTGWGITTSAVNGLIPGVLYQRIVVPFNANVHLQFDMASNIVTDGAHLRVKVSTSDPAGWVDPVAGGGEAFLYNNTPAGLIAAGSGNPFAATLTHVDLGNIALNAGIYFLSFQVDAQHTLTIDNISGLATYGVATTEIPTPWSADEVAAVRYVTETGRDRTVFVHPGHAPWYLLFGGQVGNWSFGNVIFTALPVAWGDAGSNNVPVGWNWQGQAAVLAQANWPAAVEMLDGRIYYAGEPAQKNRILGSRSGSSDDFTIGANPGDALDYKIATKGSILWLRAARLMLAGTDLGEHAITGSKGTPLVADIQAREEASFPSSSIQAVKAGTQAMFISSDLRRMRSIAFEFQTNGYEAKDVTFIAEHLTDPAKAGLIKEVHHAWTPESVYLLLRTDGKLAIVTFEPTEQVTAWWTADVGGSIYTASVSQGPLGAYLWMAVGRGGSVYLEKLHLSESTETLNYLDASISANADGGGRVAGLDHLIGLKVRAISGGVLVGDFEVNADGSIQLGADHANAAVVVGLAYLARGVTLPRDLKTGKGQSPNIGVILNNSAIPKINGKRPPNRIPGGDASVTDNSVLVTGKRQLINLGWSEEDTVTIEQDLPFRTEVCAIYKNVEDGRSF